MRSEYEVVRTLPNSDIADDVDRLTPVATNHPHFKFHVFIRISGKGEARTFEFCTHKRGKFQPMDNKHPKSVRSESGYPL